MTTDPFERAIEREKRLRKRADILGPGLIRLVMIWYAVGFVLWATVLAGHWILFSEPRWLLLVHTLIFALLLGYCVLVGSFVAFVKRRRPDFFGD